MIHPLNDIFIPNGMAVDSFGHLYVADYGTPRIYPTALEDTLIVESVNLGARGAGGFVNGLNWDDD